MSSVDKTTAGYRARWRTPDGNSRSRTFKKKIEAERHLAHIDHDKLMGAYVDPAAGRVCFRDYAERWRNAQVHRTKTAAQLETNLRRHVYPRLGERPLAAIRQSEVQALVKAMHVGGKGQQPLAPGTVKLIYGWVATVFRDAVIDRVIVSSPCRQIRLPEVATVKIEPLSIEVVEGLIDNIDRRYRAMIVLGAGTGVRISEAFGLSVDRVDWLRRTVTVDRQLAGVSGGAPDFGPVKDRRNRSRTIPAPEVVIEELSRHVGEFGQGPEGLLFTNRRGLPLSRSTFSEAWKPVAASLGIAKGDGYHQLRHFYASLLIGDALSVKVVQERLGHASAMETLDTYGHLWPADEDRTRSAVQAALGRIAGGSSTAAGG